MSGRKDRDKARGHARSLYTKYDQSVCPNCGTRGRHFAPPSLGEDGFFACSPKPEPPASTTCSICHDVHGLEAIHECE